MGFTDHIQQYRVAEFTEMKNNTSFETMNEDNNGENSCDE